MVITRSQARQLALNRPPSVSDFQGRGSDLPIVQVNEGDGNTSEPTQPVLGNRKEVDCGREVNSRKSLTLNWTPDTLPKKLRRNTVGGREAERVFPMKRKQSTSSSHRTDSKERSKPRAEEIQQSTPKFGKERMQFPGNDKLRRTPPPSPKITPRRTKSPSPVVSEEIVQTIEGGSTQGTFSVRTDGNNTPRIVMTPTVQTTTPPQWYDRGGLLRAYLPTVNTQGQQGRPLISLEERKRQEWLRWISWVWEARRRGVEDQLPRIIQNAKDNLEPSIREYDCELARLIFRAITAETLKRMPTDEEMLYGIREGFIVALQLKDTTIYVTEIKNLHNKGLEGRFEQGKGEIIKGSSREFSLEQITTPEEPPSKELNQLSLGSNMALPRRSRYFTLEQSEAESEVSAKQHQVVQQVAQVLMPRDVPKAEKKVELTAVRRLTKEALENQGEKKIDTTKITGRSHDPSPSPSSSSTSADERRRRARREKEKEEDKKKKKKKKDLSRRRKRKSDTEDDNSPDEPSDPSSSDSEVGNKKPGKKEDSSSEDSDRSERATRQQRKDFMAILKANAPKKYRGDRDPKILREWVNQVDHYMSMVKLTRRDEMRTILLLLEGDAMLWWRRNRKEFKKKGVSSWKAIKRLIVDRFMPLGYRLMLEKQLREVCQRTSAQEYASRFTHIIMQLPDYTDKQIISHFINGLKTKVRTQVISHDPTELEEAIRLAENVDDGLFAEQIATRKPPIPDPRVTRVTTYKVNQIESARKPITPSGDRKFPTSIKCYNCGKLGHISRNCRAPRVAQQQAAVNQTQKIQQIQTTKEESPNDWTMDDRSLSNMKVVEMNNLNKGIEPPKAGKLIIIYGHIGGKRAQILLDSGATASFVSEAFVKLHRLRTSTRAHPLRVFFADGRDEISLRLLQNTKLIVGRYEENVTFEVANIKYDCILGKNWHDEHRAITRNPEDVLEIKHKGKSFTFQSINANQGMGERIISTLEEVSSNMMKKEIRKGKEEVYAVTVKEAVDKEMARPTPGEYEEALREAMEGYESIFAENIPTDTVERVTTVEHYIEVQQGATPPVLPIYRMTQHELTVLKKRLHELLERGHIRPSSSPYAASALFVPKKSGELRMCVDYRMLNKQTIKNKYPLPLIDELLDKLRNANFFSKLDLSDGYYQIPVREADRAKTAFRTPYGHYEFMVMPFGLVNAPATFQRMMNDVLREFVNEFVVVYLDDIMIFSETLQQHVEHLKKVFHKLQEHKLYVKPSKSSYFQREAEYLGYVVRNSKVTPSPEKIKAIKDWPTPLPSVTAVKSFLGMAQFYKRFVENFAAIAKPLTDLTRTTKEFQWNDEAQEAVVKLKEILCKLPEMFLPDVTRPFIVRTDASNFAIGAVLSQIRDELFSSRFFYNSNCEIWQHVLSINCEWRIIIGIDNVL